MNKIILVIMSSLCCIYPYNIRNAQSSDTYSIMKVDTTVTFEYFIPTMNTIHQEMFPDAEKHEMLYYNLIELQHEATELINAINDEHSSVLGAFNDNECVGFIWGTYYSTQKTIYIDLLMILSSARRQGIAQNLVNRLIDQYPHATYSAVNPFVHAQNSDTLKFYRSQEYRFTSTIPDQFSDIFPHELVCQVAPNRTRTINTTGYYTFGIKSLEADQRAKDTHEEHEKS